MPKGLRDEDTPGALRTYGRRQTSEFPEFTNYYIPGSCFRCPEIANHLLLAAKTSRAPSRRMSSRNRGDPKMHGMLSSKQKPDRYQLFQRSLVETTQGALLAVRPGYAEVEGAASGPR